MYRHKDIDSLELKQSSCAISVIYVCLTAFTCNNREVKPRVNRLTVTVYL